MLHSHVESMCEVAPLILMKSTVMPCIAPSREAAQSSPTERAPESEVSPCLVCLTADGWYAILCVNGSFNVCPE